MGLFSDLKDKIGGSIKGTFDAISGKAGVEAQQEASQIQQEQFNKIFDLNAPFADMANEQLPFLSQNATAEGFGSNLSALMNNQNLTGPGKEFARQMFLSSGITPNESLLNDSARIDDDKLLSIENELNRRKQALTGVGMTGLDQQNQANSAFGNAQATGILGGAQARAQGASNIGNILGSLLQARS